MPPIDDPVDETDRLLAAAESEGLDVRALGGAAFGLRLAAVGGSPFTRIPKDIDLVTTAKNRSTLERLLVQEGYEADREFNLQSGHTRLLFWDRARGRQVDVFLDDFTMCHPIPLKPRLTTEPKTIPLAELLLTKLQIVELNDKDRSDLVVLLDAAEVGDRDGWLVINSRRVAELCAADWGLWRTVDMNLGRLREHVAPRADQRGAAMQNITALADAIAAMEKSRKWKLRAKVGDRVRWYRSPEEVV